MPATSTSHMSKSLNFGQLLSDPTKHHYDDPELMAKLKAKMKAKMKAKKPQAKKRIIVSRGPTTMIAANSEPRRPGSLRPIVIDGSNVAMLHGSDVAFSVPGIQIVVNYFRSRGHTKIVAFVPQFRSELGKTSDPKLLQALESEGIVVFTPSSDVNKKRKIRSYDDTFILDYAAAHGGIVISQDNFRDLVYKKPEWRAVIENRVLKPYFMHGDNLKFARGDHEMKTFLSF